MSAGKSKRNFPISDYFGFEMQGFVEYQFRISISLTSVSLHKYSLTCVMLTRATHRQLARRWTMMLTCPLLDLPARPCTSGLDRIEQKRTTNRCRVRRIRRRPCPGSYPASSRPVGRRADCRRFVRLSLRAARAVPLPAGRDRWLEQVICELFEEKNRRTHSSAVAEVAKTVPTVGAVCDVCDRPHFVNSRKTARSQTAPTIDTANSATVPTSATGLIGHSETNSVGHGEFDTAAPTGTWRGVYV